MSNEARRTLAANLRRVVEHYCRGERYSERAWAVHVAVDPKQLHRAMRDATSTTLDTLQTLADAVGVEPWALLHPDFNPQKLPMPAHASGMAREIARALDAIPDTERKTRAYALMAQLAQFEADGPPVAVPPVPEPRPAPAPAPRATRPRAKSR